MKREKFTCRRLISRSYARPFLQQPRTDTPQLFTAVLNISRRALSVFMACKHRFVLSRALITCDKYSDRTAKLHQFFEFSAVVHIRRAKNIQHGCHEGGVLLLVGDQMPNDVLPLNAALQGCIEGFDRLVCKRQEHVQLAVRQTSITLTLSPLIRMALPLRDTNCCSNRTNRKECLDPRGPRLCVQTCIHTRPVARSGNAKGRTSSKPPTPSNEPGPNLLHASHLFALYEGAPYPSQERHGTRAAARLPANPCLTVAQARPRTF